METPNVLTTSEASHCQFTQNHRGSFCSPWVLESTSEIILHETPSLPPLIGTSSVNLNPNGHPHGRHMPRGATGPSPHNPLSLQPSSRKSRKLAGFTRQFASGGHRERDSRQPVGNSAPAGPSQQTQPCSNGNC